MDEMDLQERKAFLTRIEAHLERNELETVLNLAQARLQGIPGDLDARIVICRVWLLQGRLDEARDLLHEMEEILASLSQVYVCMGDIYMKKGMGDVAEDYYGKFKVLNPGAPLVRERSRLKGSEEPHETEGEGETEGAAVIPSDFQTVTLAELYIRQGHLRPAAELLEKIVEDDPQNGKAAALLAEVREQLRGETPAQPYAEVIRETSAQPHAEVIAELSRWLDNIGRLRGHAA
jgi:tetratricopeptide (TPR) repeat protein